MREFVAQCHQLRPHNLVTCHRNARSCVLTGYDRPSWLKHSARLWTAITNQHLKGRKTQEHEASFRVRATDGASAEAVTPWLEDSLQQVDRDLAREGDAAEAQAVGDVEELKAQGLLRAFGGAAQVPKRQYTLQDLRLHNIEPQNLLSPEDKTLKTIRNVLQGALAGGFAVAYFGLHWDGAQLLATAVAVLFLLSVDQVANGGGFEALAVDVARRAVQQEYGRRVALHEAGHFLIAYLVGILPRRYTLSSLDAFRKYGALNVQAGTQFCDAAFQREVAKGGLSSASLDRFTCVALAGVAAEYVDYGQAEGGLNDVLQLDSLLRALQFSQRKADDQVRWALLNVVTILRRHAKTHRQLAEAMSSGKSVGQCILLIEESLSSTPAADI